jgi:hypothetical protein
MSHTEKSSTPAPEAEEPASWLDGPPARVVGCRHRFRMPNGAEGVATRRQGCWHFAWDDTETTSSGAWPHGWRHGPLLPIEEPEPHPWTSGEPERIEGARYPYRMPDGFEGVATWHQSGWLLIFPGTDSTSSGPWRDAWEHGPALADEEPEANDDGPPNGWLSTEVPAPPTSWASDGSSLTGASVLSSTAEAEAIASLDGDEPTPTTNKLPPPGFRWETTPPLPASAPFPVFELRTGALGTCNLARGCWVFEWPSGEVVTVIWPKGVLWSSGAVAIEAEPCKHIWYSDECHLCGMAKAEAPEPVDLAATGQAWADLAARVARAEVDMALAERELQDVRKLEARARMAWAEALKAG